MFEDRIYAIVDTAAFTAELSAIDLEVMFEKVIESSIDTLRHSVCGTPQFIVKASNEADIMYLRERAATLDIPYTEYSHSEILEVMATSAWSLPFEF